MGSNDRSEKTRRATFARRLIEVADIIMGQSPPGITYNQVGDGLPFFQGVADFNYRYPTPRVFCSAPSRIAVPGDILLSVRAPIGRVNIADRECAIGRGLAIIRPKAPEDARYLEFALRLQEPRWHAIEGSGSVFGNATRSDLESLPLPWPESPHERRAIAHILGTLDDKIELNRRMSETLEQMARTLFKAWFVDFEPVRAKMEGRWRRGESLPGLPAHLYDLFPDRLVDSELGEIPEGWRVGRLGKFLAPGLGGAWGKDESDAHGAVSARCLRGIDCHELAEGRIPDVPARWFQPKQIRDRQLRDASILIEGSGSYCGRSLLWNAAYCTLFDEPVIYSNFCKRLDPLCTPSQALVCWYHIRHAYRNGDLMAFRTGTAFPYLDVAGLLGSLLVVLPSEPVAQLFARSYDVQYRVALMREAR